MTILSVLATIFGTIGGLANLPQVYRIFKRKSAKDISIFTYSFLLIGGIIWVLYGLNIQSFPLVISNLIGSLSMLGVVVGWVLYGR